VTSSSAEVVPMIFVELFGATAGAYVTIVTPTNKSPVFCQSD
jgi:hypothetical protein